MPDYSFGKVYKIVGNGKVYVGSTTRPLLSQRLAKHKNEYKGWMNGKSSNITSYECITDPECYIELLELCPCNCIDELRKCEGKWIRELDCVNRNIAGQTRREWYELNREKICDYQKQNREVNAESISIQRKAHYQSNRERIIASVEVCRRRRLLAAKALKDDQK